ncbi:hypothetical protein [Rhodoferax sp.]|nr:hypothetical protein [Rhodoferax sp.]MDD2918264.1 hypothetical protein [Rhodoferax sp.]
MSQILINDYLKQLDIIKKASGSQRETAVSVETVKLVEAMKAARR